MSGRPPFITFEGGEGCGKSTQVRLLCRRLDREGIPHVKTKEPGGTPIGKSIRRLILAGKEEPTAQAELLLFFADRAQHVRQVVLPALRAGRLVVCDRYLDSTWAYQSAAKGFGRREILALHRFAAYGLMPDLTFLLDLDCRVGLRRQKRRKDRLERLPLSYHEKVRRGFLAVARREPGRVVVLDARASPADLHVQICRHLAERFGVFERP